MRRIGILNIQHGDNYGAVLLAYALQRTLESLGYNAQIIDYRPEPVPEHSSLFKRVHIVWKRDGITGVIKKIKKKIIGKIKPQPMEPFHKKQERFERFRLDYLDRSRIYKEITPYDVLPYDTYIVGSDVIWKPLRIVNEEAQVYLLEFTDGKPCRRIAYAASIGTDNETILNTLAERYKNGISRFDRISMREKTSIDFLNRFTDKRITWCADPTLLLDKREYELLIKDQKTRNQNYIYVYLFEDKPQVYHLINQISEAQNRKVICKCPNPDALNHVSIVTQEDGPLEFLERIRDSDLVITDSFHGTVFSILFEKRFYTVSRGDISIRMEDLLERLDLKHRYITSPEKFILQEEDNMNYKKVKRKIHIWREESIAFLNTSIENQDSKN